MSTSAIDGIIQPFAFILLPIRISANSLSIPLITTPLSHILRPIRILQTSFAITQDLPLPHFASSFHSPSYTLPSLYVNVPSYGKALPVPLIMSSRHSPSYLSPSEK
eukprot:TRINITY_DN9562_c0_g1_i1.p2 TRINITY_DN9562_c0_g1~~TRINITY_DN9562_c0_g1_i1.p2  ORF type:complete len:107 (+),score=5.14 TRINITY_DN9562_c0_g1_i1:563-883(+)